MPEPKRILKVFLCHAHSDQDVVSALHKRLLKDGIDAWLDKEKLFPGDDWEYQIRRAVRDSDLFIVCLSENFTGGGFRQKEVQLALNEAVLKPKGKIFIIPLRLDNCNVPQKLRILHRVDYFEKGGYSSLVKTLDKARNDLIAVDESPPENLARANIKTSKRLLSDIIIRPSPSMDWRTLLAVLALLLTLFTIFFGNNIYQQIKGHSLFATWTVTASQITEPSQTLTKPPTGTPTATQTSTSTITPSLTNTPTPSSTATETSTQTPRPETLRGIDQSCIDKKYWKVTGSTGELMPTPTGNCYNLISWGIVADDSEISIVVPNAVGVTRAIYTAFTSYQHVEISFDVQVNELSKTNDLDTVLVLGVGRADAVLTDGHFIFYRDYSDTPVLLEYGDNMRSPTRPVHNLQYSLGTLQHFRFSIDGLTLEIYLDEQLFQRVLLDSKDHEGFWIGYRLANGGKLDAEITNLVISK
jgi:hypothetical protein